MTWMAESDGITLVVHPVGDLRVHEPFNEECWCDPFWDDNVLVHNSADRREEYEPGGGRKPS